MSAAGRDAPCVYNSSLGHNWEGGLTHDQGVLRRTDSLTQERSDVAGPILSEEGPNNGSSNRVTYKISCTHLQHLAGSEETMETKPATRKAACRRISVPKRAATNGGGIGGALAGSSYFPQTVRKREEPCGLTVMGQNQ